MLCKGWTMDRDTPEIPARYYVRMCERLSELGVDVRRILAEAEIDVELFAKPNALLRLDQVERFIDAAEALTGRTDLGFELGKALKLTSHNIVGFAILSSPNVAYALRLVGRYFGLIMPAFGMRFQYDDEYFELIFSPIISMTQACLVFHLEVIAVAVHLEVRELLQQRMPPYDLYLSTPKPIHSDLYAQLHEARSHFLWETTPSLRMKFPIEIASRPLALADPSALQIAEERCRELAQGVMGDGKVSEWVSMMLREASDGMPSMAELAHMLNLSPRTLDRYLNKEGVRYRDLAQEILHKKAIALLTAKKLSIAQIAYELGYTDSANFSRAFKRQAGVSPTSYQINCV